MSMPQLFPQFNRTEAHLSVFARAAHSSTGKTGTCFHRLHISKHVSFGNIFWGRFLYTCKEHECIFFFSILEMPSNIKLDQTVSLFDVQDCTRRCWHLACVSASLRVHNTIFCIVLQRCWWASAHSLMFQHQNDSYSCQIWLQYILAQPCKHGWACVTQFCASVMGEWVTFRNNIKDTSGVHTVS